MRSNKEKFRWLFLLNLSAILHAVLWLFFSVEKTIPPRLLTLGPVHLKIKIPQPQKEQESNVSEPKIPPKTLPPTPVPPGKRKTTRDKQPGPEPRIQKPPTYRDLLGISPAPRTPHPTDSEWDEGNEGEANLVERFGVKEAEQIEWGMGEIAFSFQIPYAFRAMKEEGKAHGRLNLKEGNQLYLSSLYGNPYIRAVLFDSLHDKTNQDLIKELLNRINEKSLLLKLCFVPKWSMTQRFSRHETSWQLVDNTMTIFQYYYLNPSSNSGIEISNEIIERERARDRLALRALRNSPAFKHPLRDIRL